MNLGTFQTYIGDPQMKKREFQVGQPVFPSPDGTEPKDGERSRSPSSIQMTVKVVIWNIVQTDSVCTHQTGQNIVQSIWSTTTKKSSRTVFVISQARNLKSIWSSSSQKKRRRSSCMRQAAPCRKCIPSKLTCRKRNNIVPTPGRRCFYSASSTISTRTPVSPTFPRFSTVGSSYANT